MLPDSNSYMVNTQTGCWEWLKALSDGYGVFWHEGTTIRAHRFYYEQAHGEIPPGLQIDHLCRNRACVNPEHLEVVTSQENTRRGSNTRLSIVEAKEIRLWSKVKGLARGDIAAAYGITAAHLSNILAGRVWKDA